jgi:hypothetical protein
MSDILVKEARFKLHVNGRYPRWFFEGGTIIHGQYLSSDVVRGWLLIIGGVVLDPENGVRECVKQFAFADWDPRFYGASELVIPDENWIWRLPTAYHESH